MKSLFVKSLIVSSALSAALVGQNASANSGDLLRWQSIIGIAQANNASEPDVAFLIRVGSGRWIANATVLR